MANCTYTFTDGTTIKGIPALKAFLVNGGLDTYLPERAMEMQGPSASARQTDTPEFKRWFGDSKVVDKNGKPLVVYHGTNADIEEFGGFEYAGWFSNTPTLAEDYTRPIDSSDFTGPNVMPVYLSIKNPFRLNVDMNDNVDAIKPTLKKLGLDDDLSNDYGRGPLVYRVVNSEKFAKALYDSGYDGIIAKENGVETFAPSQPTQIKSAVGNTGAFDPENPDIRFSRRAQPLTPADVLKPETIAKAEAAIAQYKKAEPPDPLTTKQRAHGEQLLEPVFEAARRNKAEFDATLDRIGESVNGYAKKPGIKKPYRAVTKLAIENKWDVEGMKDLLRGTIVVSTPADVQRVMDSIGEVYKFDRIKNRLSISITNAKGETVEGKPLPTGYQDVLTNVVLPDGTVAEIQISTPAMVAAKSLGHQIYSFEREMPESPVKSRMVEIQKQIYSEGGNFGLAAKTLNTLSNSALSTGSAFSRTSEGLRGSGSGTQAVAERQSGETVTGTSFQSKNMVPGGRDLKSNFIRTSDPIIPESIGINVNQDGTNQYADKIVDGQKTLETRASDSLRPYVGKRVAIVRTGDGPAKAIGAVTIGEPIRVSTQKQFDQYRDQTLVPKDSKFDIVPGGVKYLYPVENPVRYATELDVGLGIVARKVIAPSLSRREQKNAAASRVEGTSADRFKRTPALQQAVVDLQEGKITRDEYNRMVDEMRPVYPYEKVPALTTPTDAKYALANGRGQSPEKAAKYGRPSMTLIKGDWAQLRLDIPSYQEHDAWVVSVHTPKSTNREVQAAYDAGPVVGYESVAALTDVTFGMNQKMAARIATGTAKGTIATMLGKWSPISKADAKARAEAAIKDLAWTQVGMDPFRHSYFYDRDSMRPVLSADEVIQIGPLVLAKNAQFGEDTDITGAQIAFSARQTDTPEFKRWFGDSEVVDDAGKPMVVYHSTPEDFSVFDTARSELGSHFGPAEQANAFGGSNGRRIMPVYLSIKKPIRLVDYGQWDAANTWGQLVDLGVVEDEGDKISDSLVGMATGGAGDKVVQDALIKAGYDGIVYLNRREGFDPFGPDGVDGNELDEMTDEEVMDYFPEAQDSYIVFKPTQIKSAVGNTGAFDPENPDIRFSPRQFPSARGQRFTLQDETYTKTVQRNLQDYFARVADVQGALSAQGGKVGEAQNVYLAEELSYGRLQEQMVDFKEDMLKPLIKEAKAAGLELSDLALYAYAKHAPERNQAIAARNKTFGKGEGSGMTTSEANNIMRAFKAEGKDTALADLHDKLMQITQATRLVLLSEGLITQDQFDSLQRQYSDYVPLRGFTEDEDLESGRPVAGPRVGGRGFNIRGKETMRALGRESRAGHVIENIVIDYERAVARAERNNVAKVFLDLVTTNPDPGLWEIDSVRTKAAFDRATGMVSYNTLIDKGEDTISVKIDGNEIYIKIKDPLLLRAMRNAGKDETGAIDRVLAMTLGRYTALMRNTLTRYNPAFGFTNAVKDLGFGAVSALSDLGPKGAALFFKNYANPVQSGQMFEEFRAAGATTGGWHIRDQQEMQKELQRLVEWEGGSSIKSTAYSMGKATLDALEFIGQYSETQARFAAYKAARQLNKSPADAASIAKNLTTNFNRRGEWGSAMNTMYLFFNAGVQGSVKTVKNLRSPYVMAAMAGLSGMAAGLAFMGAGVGGDDDDGEAYWDKIPQFEKERNLIVMLPPGEGMLIKGESKVGKNGRYLKLPIQYGINVFSTLGYQIADLARYTQNHSRGASPAKAATNMVSVTFGSFNPFGGGFNPSKPAEVALAVSPSIVDLGVQALMGVNSFGTPVAPRKYDDVKPDAENFGPGMAGTWEQRLARWLSESTGGDRAVGGAIDVSPGSIRNIVRNLTGGTGDFLTSVFVNIPSKMWSPEGEVGPRDVPVLKAFYGEVDDVTDSKLFYERKAEVLEAAKQASDRQKLGIEVEYDPESKGLQSLSKSAEKYTKKMTELRKQELKVAEDSSLTEAQKNTERKAIQKERAQIASEFNALYYGMKKDLAAVK